MGPQALHLPGHAIYITQNKYKTNISFRLKYANEKEI